MQSYKLLLDPTKNFNRKNPFIFHAYSLKYQKHPQCPRHVCFSPPFCFIGPATLVYLGYKYKISDKGNQEPSSLERLDKHTKHIQVDVGNAAKINSPQFPVYLKATLFHPLLLSSGM